MKFLCPSCKAKYQIADEKVVGRSVRMKCRKCGFVIPLSEIPPAPATVPPDESTATMPVVPRSPGAPAIVLNTNPPGLLSPGPPAPAPITQKKCPPGCLQAPCLLAGGSNHGAPNSSPTYCPDRIPALQFLRSVTLLSIEKGRGQILARLSFSFGGEGLGDIKIRPVGAPPPWKGLMSPHDSLCNLKLLG